MTYLVLTVLATMLAVAGCSDDTQDLDSGTTDADSDTDSDTDTDTDSDSDTNDQQVGCFNWNNWECQGEGETCKAVCASIGLTCSQHSSINKCHINNDGVYYSCPVSQSLSGCSICEDAVNGCASEFF